MASYATAQANQPDAPASAETFGALWQQAQQQHGAPEARSYLQRMRHGGSWRDGATLRAVVPPHDKALLECVTAIVPTPSPVRMVFREARDATVTEAATDQPGYIAECLPRKIIGLRLPAPPHDGFLLCQRFEKKDGEHSTVSPCGPVGWTERCEQQGTTQHCRNEFKAE